MIESIINCKNIKEAEVVVLSAPYGHSFTYRSGAENGPHAIVECLHGNLEFFDRFLQEESFRSLKIFHHDLKGLNKLSPDKMVQKIQDFYTNHSDKFIVLLGGDHSVSIGSFFGISKLHKPSDVTILQIDAHPDLRDSTYDYKKTSDKFSHASTMRRGCELGFKSVQVGIRTYSIFDSKFIKKNNLKVFEWGRGKKHSIKSIIDSIKTKKVYLTIDVDGLDPAHMPATGTPVPGGLEWHYTRKLIRSLIKSRDLVGADIVEVSPIKDDVLTQYAAAQLSYDIISYKLLKDKGKLSFYE
ncbi:MAG: agmatinase [Parcubacteria group bacterium]|nr:agmatinase [Parcubacteria group bacterium]